MKFLIFNYQLSKKTRRGYTLIEMLAVTTILVIIGGLITGVIYSTLRGSSKVKITNDVTQNGNYALTVMARTALLAGYVSRLGNDPIDNCVTPRTSDSIEFVNQDGGRVTFSCNNNEQSIASSSGSMTSYLIDNTTVKIEPNSCRFTCTQPNNDSYATPVINIAFKVSQRQGSLFENAARSEFQTSVTMRNYRPR